jgi:hypothetical protein
MLISSGETVKQETDTSTKSAPFKPRRPSLSDEAREQVEKVEQVLYEQIDMHAGFSKAAEACTKINGPNQKGSTTLWYPEKNLDEIDFLDRNILLFYRFAPAWLMMGDSASKWKQADKTGLYIRFGSDTDTEKRPKQHDGLLIAHLGVRATFELYNQSKESTCSVVDSQPGYEEFALDPEHPVLILAERGLKAVITGQKEQATGQLPTPLAPSAVWNKLQAATDQVAV